jgi:hypothetical protein
MAARAVAAGLAGVLAMMLCACVESGTISPVSDDVIDLYNRVRVGTPVVVLPRGRFSFSTATPFRPTV